jgi:hypothetical protein
VNRTSRMVSTHEKQFQLLLVIPLTPHIIMLKIAIVGDLSFNDPKRLAIVLDAALGVADCVIQVGDLHPGYDVVKYRLNTNKLLVVPGNHDTEWERFLSLPRQWIRRFPGVCLIGLDNSNDQIDQDGWSLLNGFAPINDKEQLFLFMHKPLSTIVFPDGTESNHIMGEGSSCPDAVKLQQWATSHHATLCHGHYHGWTLMNTSYGTVIVDGRGGAASQLGYTLFSIQPEGWSAHAISL